MEFVNEIDDSNLAICFDCGFVDDWVEIPGGRCAVSGEGFIVTGKQIGRAHV